MTTDPADALRSLASELESDALELDPTTPAEGGLAQGLGRAVARARTRAEQLEDD